MLHFSSFGPKKMAAKKLLNSAALPDIPGAGSAPNFPVFLKNESFTNFWLAEGHKSKHKQIAVSICQSAKDAHTKWWIQKKVANSKSTPLLNQVCDISFLEFLNLKFATIFLIHPFQISIIIQEGCGWILKCDLVQSLLTL